MPQQTLSETVNILLTPQFYSVKKEPLPIKYAFQAKKIAPSLFDGFLENAENYEYYVYKEGEDWVFIAYDPATIHAFLESKGIKSEQVGKIFFAQQALASFSAPVLLGERDALVSINNSVVLVPKVALQKGMATITVDESFTPKHGIVSQGSFNSFISQKQAIALATLFSIFALTFFVEGQRYAQSSQDTQAEIAALLEEYPSLESAYTRQSIAEKYRAIDKNERKKRDSIKKLSGMFFKGVGLKSFKMNEKGFSVFFRCTDATVTKQLIALSKKEGFSSVKILSGNIVNIEGKL
jgi:hypothetical protein